MSMMAAAASAFDEHLRRVQSTGDLPNPVPSIRPSPRGSLRRSEGVVQLQRPAPLHLPERNRAAHSSLDSLEAVLAQINGTPPPSPRPLPSRRQQQRRDEETPTLLEKLLMACGLSGADAKARREFISFVWNVGFAIAQYIIIITLLAYSSHHESPTQPGFSEWDACDRPLGVWNCIWLIRVALGLLMSIWGYKRERAARFIRERRERNEDRESPQIPALSPHRFPRADHDAPSGQTLVRDDTDRGNGAPELRGSQLYSRLGVVGTFVSLAWFLTAHILEYTSVNDCRHTSPHLWWTTFGILCILYLMVLEIFLLGLLVFVFGPVLYLLWHIVLLCLGRHPLQNPHQIKPEIGKLPKHVVDQIPLVLYIPPPPEEPTSPANPASSTDTPSPSYSYPPAGKPATKKPKRRFAFFRRRGKPRSGGGSEKDRASSEKGGQKEIDPDKMAWEERWEPGDYPFARLEGNRAVCAICLLDFEPPKRIDGTEEQPDAKAQDAGEGGDAKEDDVSEKVDLEAGAGGVDDGASDESVHTVQVGEVTEEERQQLRLDDAGEGPVPLRLLGCGHVYHQTCVDPWLADVSGRCPVCQRPVLDSTKTKPKKRHSRR